MPYVSNGLRGEKRKRLFSKCHDYRFHDRVDPKLYYSVLFVILHLFFFKQAVLNLSLHNAIFRLAAAELVISTVANRI